MGSIVTAEKPTIFLVPGAWHEPDCWDAVTLQLEEYGYPFSTVQLLSSGGELSTSVAEDASHIQKSISKLADAGKDIILVMHSYGGIAGTESAKGLLKKDRQAEGKLGGIISLVYITAFLLPPQTSLASFLGFMPPWVVFDGDKMTVDGAENIFYNDLPEHQTKDAIAKLNHQAKPTFYTNLTYPAYQEVPASYLLCEKDNAIPFVAQQAMAGIGGPGLTSYVCSSSHSPMLSMPGKVVEVIRASAGEDIVVA
ncbi:Alpha/beta hydrolase fold-1 [Trichoderma sp. SZMC 28011]